MKIKKEWHKLSNGYWEKIIYRYNTNFFDSPVWTMDLFVAKTKRIINDMCGKSHKSPKKCYIGQSTNHNQNGIESLTIALKSLLRFISKLPKNSKIRIEGNDKQRINVYSRLTRYGFIAASYYRPERSWHKRKYYFKET